MVIEHWLNIAVVILLVLNTLGAIVTVFRDKTRDITTVWAWMLVLLLFPVFGFAFYFLTSSCLQHGGAFLLRSYIFLLLFSSHDSIFLLLKAYTWCNGFF